ncbi:hypothetical protein [Clostridium estertheticum]|uniref:Uncharacterized protein n=1 Tax=Clostridium estertheticum TaxID=238834 RepID=A0AA47EN06_9CLOT|nr:hypothetical protein [Clostridium estertheticum]MBU3157622.1 hypothetical protein [Clostridium estertheticum]WAG63239.1 hypothetical protein LL038_24745 [Clostridium estertheticum]
MLTEIPIKELPTKNIKEVESTCKASRIPFLKTEDLSEVSDIISANCYLEVIVYILYFMNIEGYPINISLPETIKLENLSSLPFICNVNRIFSYQRAIVDDNSIVTEIQVKDLRPQTIKFVEELVNLNRIDPIFKMLFKSQQSDLHINSNSSNNVRAYIINKETKNLENELISNIQKYLLWECINNNGIYGIPISGLSIYDFENKCFQDFIRFFGETYVVGSGEPWKSTHLIISKPEENSLTPLLESKLRFSLV